MHGNDIKGIVKKFEGFGWDTVAINGHDYNFIINTLQKVKKNNGKPKAIIADTFKGKYFP